MTTPQGVEALTVLVDAFGTVAKDYGIALQKSPGYCAKQRSDYLIARDRLLAAIAAIAGAEPVARVNITAAGCTAPTTDPVRAALTNERIAQIFLGSDYAPGAEIPVWAYAFARKIEAERAIDYGPVFQYAEANRLSYNEACSMVRAALSAPTARADVLDELEDCRLDNMENTAVRLARAIEAAHGIKESP
jgi:hypothetical protein